MSETLKYAAFHYASPSSEVRIHRLARKFLLQREGLQKLFPQDVSRLRSN
jgi:hypothetical protein